MHLLRLACDAQVVIALSFRHLLSVHSRTYPSKTSLFNSMYQFYIHFERPRVKQSKIMVILSSMLFVIALVPPRAMRIVGRPSNADDIYICIFRFCLG